MGTGAGRYTGQALNATAPLQRDTVLIPAYSWIVLRFITDNRNLLFLSPLSRQSLICAVTQRACGRSIAISRGIWQLGC